MRNRWFSAAAVTLMLGAAAVAHANELPGDGGGDNPFGPTNQLAEAVKNPVGTVIYWECAGPCAKGDKCCRPTYSQS